MIQQYFTITVNTTTSLAELVLSLVLTLYFFRLKKKTYDTKIFLLLLGSSVLYYFFAMALNSCKEGTVLHRYCDYFHLTAVALQNLASTWFAYSFAGNYFRRERKIVMYALVLLLPILSVGWFLGYVVSTMLGYTLVALYVPVIFYRKKLFAEKDMQTSEQSMLFQDLQRRHWLHF